MKCFIHTKKEAISVCTKCGKAMCQNCSAYSQHSGICPECRRDELIKIKQIKEDEINENKTKMRNNILYLILVSILSIIAIASIGLYGLVIFVFAPVFAIKIILINNKNKPIKNEIARLVNEIDKLTNALNKGIAEI